LLPPPTKVAGSQNGSRASCHFSIGPTELRRRLTFGFVVAAAHQLWGRKGFKPYKMTSAAAFVVEKKMTSTKSTGYIGGSKNDFDEVAPRMT